MDSLAVFTFGVFSTSGGGESSPIPDDVVDLEARAIGLTSIYLTWDFSKNTDSFDIYRGLNNTTFVNIANVNITSFVDNGLLSGTQYFYKVISKNINGDLANNYSNIANATTLKPTQSSKPYYYPETIRSITTSLIAMLDGIVVKRYDGMPSYEHDVVKVIQVPISFGHPDKRHLEELRGDSTGFQSPPLPRMAITMDGIDYDAERASGVNNVREFYNEALGLDNINEFITDIQPAPYNYNFTLHIKTDSLSDFSQIVENILPYFNPMRMIHVKEFYFLNIERDLPVIMGGITPQFTSDVGIDERKEINATISLTVQGWMYRPITSAKVIKYINSDYFIQDTGGDAIQTTTYTINTSGISGTIVNG